MLSAEANVSRSQALSRLPFSLGCLLQAANRGWDHCQPQSQRASLNGGPSGQHLVPKSTLAAGLGLQGHEGSVGSSRNSQKRRLEEVVVGREGARVGWWHLTLTRVEELFTLHSGCRRTKMKPVGVTSRKMMASGWGWAPLGTVLQTSG